MEVEIISKSPVALITKSQIFFLTLNIIISVVPIPPGLLLHFSIHLGMTV